MPFEDPRYVLGGYREHPPPPDLRDVVAALWTYERAPGEPELPGRGHRVLPDLDVSLCWWSVGGGGVGESSVRIMGPIHRIRFFAPPEGLRIAAVRLKAEWSRPLLGADPLEHADAVDPADRRIAGRARREELARADRPEGALAVLLRFLADRRAAASPDRATRLAHAGLEHVRASRGSTLELEAPCRELGVSLRHLRRSITEAGGASPKAFHRTGRLNRAVALADRPARPRWARLAVSVGYYDQAHLVRECRTLSGLPPTALRAERRAQGRPSA